ncbi:MAG TPA: dTMP kinase [Acidimicrobiales bacterium]|jgi:dTMP kinase|nr:dTMP kinase [Acidimicrobiales bacterium]
MSTTRRGRLIALEGIDGCGKSTQAALLAEHLGGRLTFEPGATPLGTALRQLVLNPTLPDVDARAEALLMAADRAQHTAEVIEPLLVEGISVVTDRFTGSTLAYQGFGRGLDLGALVALNRLATAGTSPDVNVLIDVPVELARARMEPARADRLERLGPAFQDRVHDGYRELAGSDPGAWVVVDGTGDVAVVAERVRRAVADRLDHD